MGIDLTGKEICNIIKACKENGVTKLELGSLRLNFGATPEPADPQAPLADPPTNQPQSDPTDQKLQLTVGDEEQLKEVFFAQQLIDDPVGFETELADGFMEKDRVENETSGH